MRLKELPCSLRDIVSAVRCFHKETLYPTNQQKAKLVTTLSKVLENVLPSPSLTALMKQVFRDVWEQRAAQVAEQKASLRLVLRNTKINGFLNRVIEASNATVVAAYEKQIDKLEREKLTQTEQLATHGTPQRSFDEVFEHAMRFLANPWSLWNSDRLIDKRTLLKLTFSKHLIYCRKHGFRTPEMSIPFRALEDFSHPKKALVEVAGFEPASREFL